MTRAPSTDRETVRAEAAAWLNLRLSGDMDGQDEARFRQWLQRGPEQRAHYQAVERHWGVAAAVRDDPLMVASRARSARRYALYRKWMQWRGYAGGLVASLLVIAVVAGYPALPGGGAETGVRFTNPKVARMATSLPDGSAVTLDADSEMRVKEMGEKRVVELVRGRAFFRVAKDPSRPFSVAAAGKVIHAIGTAFDVRIVGGDVIVTLVEGKVRIDEAPRLFKASPEINLTAGTQLIARSEQPWLVGHVDLAKETSWHEGRLTFLGDTLASAMDEVNRYATRKLVFVDGPVPDRQIVGVFQAGDTEAFVTALEMNGIAKRDGERGNMIRLSAR